MHFRAAVAVAALTFICFSADPQEKGKSAEPEKAGKVASSSLQSSAAGK